MKKLVLAVSELMTKPFSFEISNLSKTRGVFSLRTYKDFLSKMVFSKKKKLKKVSAGRFKLVTNYETGNDRKF